MPIYEYRCATCGFQHEYLQRVSDPLLTKCPDCGKPTFKKLLTAAGFQLKGSGWYVTDFKNTGSKPPAPKDKGGDKSAEKASDKPADGNKAADKPAESDKPADKPASKKDDAKSEAARGTGACPASS